MTELSLYKDFLAIAVEANRHAGAPLRVTLPLCKRVREGFEKAMYIWEAHLKDRRSESLDQCLEFEDEWTRRVEMGEVTLDHITEKRV